MNATEQFLHQATQRSSRRLQDLLPQPRALAKWCACALVLLLPGSFVVLPLLWLYRRCALLSARPEMLQAVAMRPKLGRCSIIRKQSVTQA